MTCFASLNKLDFFYYMVIWQLFSKLHLGYQIFAKKSTFLFLFMKNKNICLVDKEYGNVNICLIFALLWAIKKWFDLTVLVTILIELYSLIITA